MNSRAQGTTIGHTCWMEECPGSCASGAEGRIWCLALTASQNPSPRDPAIRERPASRWMHIGGTADRQLVRGRCSECACASVMKRSPLVRPWQWRCCVVQLFFLLLPLPAVAICFNCLPAPARKRRPARGCALLLVRIHVRKHMATEFLSSLGGRRKRTGHQSCESRTVKG